MKLLHLGDLHLGKKVHGYLMAEEQLDALRQVLVIAEEQDVDGVLIAGDVYDTSMPVTQGVALLDAFLDELKKRQIPVYMIAGNHDSGIRLEFARSILQEAGVHIAGVYHGEIPYADLEKEGVKARIHFLPFIRPSSLLLYYPQKPIDTWSQAVETALEDACLLEDGYNILLSHQFYTGGRTCESESVFVGGIDHVSEEVLEKFDYAALGHLHTPQHLKNPMHRYSGTLLKYSISEIGQTKTVTMLTLDPDGLSVQEFPIVPMRDFVRVQGSLEELLSPGYSAQFDPESYFYIVLDDETEGVNAHARLSERYGRILKIEYRNMQTPEVQEQAGEAMRQRDPAELVDEFFLLQNGRPLDEQMKQVVKDLWEALDEAD